MHSFDTRWQGQGKDDREHRGGRFRRLYLMVFAELFI